MFQLIQADDDSLPDLYSIDADGREGVKEQSDETAHNIPYKDVKSSDDLK